MEVIWNIRKAIFKVSGISDLDNVDQSAPLNMQVIFFLSESPSLTKLMSCFVVIKKKKSKRFLERNRISEACRMTKKSKLGLGKKIKQGRKEFLANCQYDT